MMTFLDSSTSRLMLAVATVAAGLFAMRDQDAFALGVLAALAAFWLLLAFGEAVGRGGRDRAFWRAFLAAAVGGLILGFGPWSDRSTRGRPPTLALGADWAAWRGGLSPTSRAALTTRRLGLRPQVDRSTIETLDRGGRVIHRVEVAVRPGAAPDAEEFGRYLNQGVFDALNDNLTRAGQGDPVSYLWDRGADRVLFSPTPPPGSMSSGTFLMARPDESIFMDAWHLLVALGLGWLAGGCLLAGRQARRIYRHLKGEPRPPLIKPAEM